MCSKKRTANTARTPTDEESIRITTHFKSICTLCLLGILLAGCAAASTESPPAPSSPASAMEEAPAAEALPPELLDWVAGSGWEIAPDMLAQQSMPVADPISGEHPERFLVETGRHRHERQQGNSCGGYACAYLLRTLGQDVTGHEVYDSLGFKINDGLVLPQGITNHLADSGYPVTLYQGNLSQLKARLSGGGVPIVLLVGDGMAYQHYITLLGYDADSLYFFDSNQPENPDAIYNAVIPNAEFLPLWENCIPGFERIYLALD